MRTTSKTIAQKLPLADLVSLPTAQPAGSELKAWRRAGVTGWQIVVGNYVSAEMTGPASATDNAIVRFDTTTGKLVQNSLGTLDDAGVLSVTGATISRAASSAPLLKATINIGATTTRYPVLYVGHNFQSGVTFGTGYAFEIGKATTGTPANGNLYLRSFLDDTGVLTAGPDALIVSPNGQIVFPQGLTDVVINSGSPYVSLYGASDSPSKVLSLTRSGPGAKFNTTLAVLLHTYDPATIASKTRAEIWLNDATSVADTTVDTKVLTLQASGNTSNVPLEVASKFKKGEFTVASLPSAVANPGWEAQVTNSTVAASGNYGATVAGGGSNRVKVFSNGTNWVIA